MYTGQLIHVAMYLHIHTHAVYCGHLGTNKKCPDYPGVLIYQVSLYNKAPFGTITKCVDYVDILIFKCPD